MKIYFHGATGDVTGSAYHVKTARERAGSTADYSTLQLWEIFEYYRREHPDYREQVLPESVTARVSVEKTSTLGWARYVGRGGHSIGMDTFGASAPLRELQKKFGFTAENIILAAKEQIAKRR